MQYDPSGSDTGSNTSLNREWVKLVNHVRSAKNLTGWTVRDRDGHVYKFGNFHLAPGQAVRVHTGRGTDTGTDVYWDADSYVWNNSGDKVILRSWSGAKVDTCSWSSVGDGKVSCGS